MNTGFAVAAGVLICLVLSMVSARAKARERRGVLAELADRLGGEVISSNSIRGTRHGVAIQLTYECRGTGSNVDPWTTISTRLPAAYPLAIDIRSHVPADVARIRDGEMIDITLGSQPFDHMFRVEAAPSDVVRALIDEPMRDLMVAYADAVLETIEDDTGRLLRLSLPTWIERPADLADVADHVARVTSHLRTAYAEGPIRDAPMTGAPYRPIRADRSRRLHEEREDELARLAVVRDERKQRSVRFNRWLWAGMVTGGVAYATVVLASNS